MHWSSLVTPSREPYAITPDDVAELPETPKGIYVGVGGDVTLRGASSGTPVTYKNVPTGAFIAVQAVQVYETGTTATDLVAEA